MGIPYRQLSCAYSCRSTKKLALVDGNKVEIQTRDSDEKGRDSKEKD